ncbi:hypothetical protein BC826DRAFT_1060163 [Russula brevipes]|nr:hypothetical protein BC826DRAFT_1060163 [Russula brevipes]
MLTDSLLLASVLRSTFDPPFLSSRIRSVALDSPSSFVTHGHSSLQPVTHGHCMHHHVAPLLQHPLFAWAQTHSPSTFFRTTIFPNALSRFAVCRVRKRTGDECDEYLMSLQRRVNETTEQLGISHNAARATHPMVLSNGTPINCQPFALHCLPIDFTVQSRSHHTVVTTTSCPLPIRRPYNSALAFAANVDENFMACDRFHSRTICSTAFDPAPREHNNRPPRCNTPSVDDIAVLTSAQRRVTITHELSSTHLTPSSDSCFSPLHPLIPLRHAQLVDGTSTTDPSHTTMKPSIKRRTMRPTHTSTLHLSINGQLSPHQLRACLFSTLQDILSSNDDNVDLHNLRGRVTLPSSCIGGPRYVMFDSETRSHSPAITMAQIQQELLHRVPVQRAPASSTVTLHCSSTSLMINSH